MQKDSESTEGCREEIIGKLTPYFKKNSRALSVDMTRLLQVSGDSVEICIDFMINHL
jgi:hypothetical protein